MAFDLSQYYNPSDWTSSIDDMGGTTNYYNSKTGQTASVPVGGAGAPGSDQWLISNYGTPDSGYDNPLASIGLNLNPYNGMVDYGNGIQSQFTRSPTLVYNQDSGQGYVLNPDGSKRAITDADKSLPQLNYSPARGNAGHGSWWDQQGVELMGDALTAAAGYVGGPLAMGLLQAGGFGSGDSDNQRMMTAGAGGALAGSLFGSPSTSGANVTDASSGTDLGTTISDSSGSPVLTGGSGNDTLNTGGTVGDDLDMSELGSGEAGMASNDLGQTTFDQGVSYPSTGGTFDDLFNSPTGQQIIKGLVGSGIKSLGGGSGGTNTAGGTGGLLGSILEYLGQNRLQGQLNTIANNAANRTDPFASQRPQYQGMLQQSYTDPNFFTNNAVFKGLNDYAVNAADRRMAASGYNLSGNEAQELTKTAATTGYNYALPFQQQLATNAGAGVNPGYAGFIQQQGLTNAANAGMASQGALGNLFGGALRSLSGMV